MKIKKLPLLFVFSFALMSCGKATGFNDVKKVVDEIYAKTSQQTQHFNKKDNKK